MNPKTESASAFAARAVNLANSGLVVLDAAQEIVLWNSWMVPRSGYSVARVRDRALFEVFPELRGSRVEAAVLAALTEEVATTVPASTGSAGAATARPGIARMTARSSVAWCDIPSWP